jgi:hypothetical protein
VKFYTVKNVSILVYAYEKTVSTFSRINPGIRARLMFAGFITLIFTAGVLQWSLNYGRLAYDVTYDDIGYFQDAFTRIQVFNTQGFGAMIAGFFQNPPHSLWSSLLAFTGFALFGPHDWAPYIMNGLTIFLFLGLLVYILRNVHFLASAVLMVLVLFVPFSFFAVHDFRPDFVVGVFTCAFSLLALESFSSGQNHDKIKLRCAGIIFGIALLSKPSFFAHTLALSFFISAFISLFPALCDRNRQQTKSKLFLFMLRDFYLPGMILAVPYYALIWRQIWDYFWVNARGENAAIWNLQGNYWEVFKNFTAVSFLMIAEYLYLFIVIILLSLILLVKKREWQDLYVVGGAISVAIISLAIMVYGRIYSPFFGLTYQIMLCIAACFCLASFYRSKMIVSILLAAFTLFSGLYVIKGKSVLVTILTAGKSPLVRTENSVNLKIIQAVDCYLKKKDLAGTSGNIFVSFAGDVNADSMRWLIQKNHFHLKISDLYTAKDIEPYKKAIKENDFIIIADGDADGIFRWLPSYAVQKPVLDFLRLQPDMKEILIVQTKKNTENSSIRIFANKLNLESKKNAFSVSPPYQMQGFLPPEGPYPQWKLPVVRWGLLPESRILLPHNLTGNIRLNLSVRATSGTKLIIVVNTARTYSHIFSSYSFENIDTSFSVGLGENVLTFRYENINQGNDLINRAVLFQNINLHAVGKDRKEVEEQQKIIFAGDIISQGRCQ